MSPISQLLGAPAPFLDRLFKALEVDGVDVQHYELDHICYRVATEARYLELKDELAALGSLLGENQIGGRSIASYRLQEPIRYQGREICVLELPAPKQGSHYPEGYEHVEFVIHQPLEHFITDHPHLAFKTKGLHKAINADIQLQYDGFGVKFHRQSLEYVIRFLDK